MAKDSPVKRILILAANPTNTARLRLDKEVSRIREGLRLSENRAQYDMQQEGAVRLVDLRRALLRHKPHIVHFCGHGEEEGLMVEDDVGKCKLVGPEALAGLFKLFTEPPNQIECVLLNACYSDNQAKAIACHIPYVIGMRQAIGDKAAVEFAVGFYDALGAGRSYEDAYQFGRNAIQLEKIPEHLTPILRKKDPTSVSPSPPSSTMPIPPPPQVQGDIVAVPGFRSNSLEHSIEDVEWSESDWKKLMLNIQHQNCILMLGPDIAAHEIEGKSYSLTEMLAHELADELLEQRPDMKAWNIDCSDLAQVAQYYCMGLEKGRTDLEEKVLTFYDKWQHQPNNIYTELAALPFYLTIITTPDDLFCQALREVKKVPFTRSYNLRRKSPEVIDEPTVDNPLIFHLYGNLDVPGSLILTENNLLDFLVAVSSKNPPLPEYILSELRERNNTLLFLGFGFKHWYLRILLHALQGDIRKERFSYALEQFVPPNMEETIFFFKTSDYRIQICKKELSSFVKQLRERYETSASGKDRIQTGPTVHICHIAEDTPIVIGLYEKLQAKGFVLWPSKEYLLKENTIENMLKQVKLSDIDYFVVLQTRAFIENIDDSLKTMIELALERQKTFRSGTRFVIPVKFDGGVPLEELEPFQTPDISDNIDELVKVINRDQQKRRKRRV